MHFFSSKKGSPASASMMHAFRERKLKHANGEINPALF
jgi:hypothetical protein